ncbi:MAG: hypothetical protein HOQ24_08665 [Mycobacteriaceae bacterium]|nr:hypothetical protein [Mycobacteriaceae bacterium]
MNTSNNVPDSPNGLQVTQVDAEITRRLGFAYTASCDGHELCRTGTYGLRWTADSREDLQDRIYPAFRAHVHDMAGFGESLDVAPDRDWGLER